MLPVLVLTHVPIGRVRSRFSECVQQRLPRGRVNPGSAGSLRRGSAMLPVILSPGSGLEDGIGLVGPAGRGDRSFLCTGVSGSVCLRVSLSSPALTPAVFPTELAWRRSPAAAASAFHPPGCLGPALRAHPRVSGRGRGVVKGRGCAGTGGHRSVLTPRCGGRLLRFGALISRLLPQVLNAWNFGRDTLSPGQERPYR